MSVVIIVAKMSSGLVCGTIAGVFGLLPLVIYSWALSKKYKGILGDDGLIELAEQLGPTKKAACARATTIDELATSSPQAWPHFVTRGGLALAYSVTFESDLFVHHISMSYQGQHLAESASSLLTAYISRVLQIPPGDMKPFRTQHGILHIVFNLEAGRQQSFCERGITVPTPAEMQSVREECLRVREEFAIPTVPLREQR